MASKLISRELPTSDLGGGISPGSNRVLVILRKRCGLEGDDTSRDADFLTYSAMEKLCEMVTWHLGHPSWFHYFLGWAATFGVSLQGNDQSPSSEKSMTEIIRRRFGLKADDASCDAEIKSLTPIEKMRHIAAWEIGDPTWADEFIKWARDCGVQVDSRK